MLGRGQTRRRRRGPAPGVRLLLEIDARYRKQAAAGELPKIAPKRFNPEGKAWLPILHAEREGWHFTALFSNTARAHDLAKTDDWVVIYFYDDDHQEGQCTVVTETHGPMEGERVVRGRENEWAPSQ
jgi:putative hydrolase